MLKDTVTAEAFAGTGSLGPAYADAVTVHCFIDPTRRLVRTSDGREVVSEATLWVHPDDSANFPPESRVTYSGNTGTVITANPATFRGQAVMTKVTLL
jgi:hypothetical protein